jgi:hypothetical protein
MMSIRLSVHPEMFKIDAFFFSFIMIELHREKPIVRNMKMC